MKPINRWTKQLNSSQYEIFNKSSPQYYQDIDGNLHSIDLSYTQSLANDKVGNYSL